MSCPAGPLRPDPAPAGVPPPTGAHRGAECVVAFRALLRPQADRDVLAHLAALRASEPEWPLPVTPAGPTVRTPPRSAGYGGVRCQLLLCSLDCLY